VWANRKGGEKEYSLGGRILSLLIGNRLDGGHFKGQLAVCQCKTGSALERGSTGRGRVPLGLIGTSLNGSPYRATRGGSLEEAREEKPLREGSV
jgi:hypothetical protein